LNPALHDGQIGIHGNQCGQDQPKKADGDFLVDSYFHSFCFFGGSGLAKRKILFANVAAGM
jgi:hypothetical protein